MATQTEWKTVDDNHRVEEGDVLKVKHCIQAPNIPFNEVLASLSTSLTDFEQKINNELPDCATVKVIDKDMYRSSGVVVDGDECEFIHETTVRVTDLQEGECPQGFLQATSISTVITVALVALALFQLTIVLQETQKLFGVGGENGGGGNNLVLVALLGAGAFALKQVNDLKDGL